MNFTSMVGEVGLTDGVQAARKEVEHRDRQVDTRGRRAQRERIGRYEFGRRVT